MLTVKPMVFHFRLIQHSFKSLQPDRNKMVGFYNWTMHFRRGMQSHSTSPPGKLGGPATPPVNQNPEKGFDQRPWPGVLARMCSWSGHRIRINAFICVGQTKWTVTILIQLASEVRAQKYCGTTATFPTTPPISLAARRPGQLFVSAVHQLPASGFINLSHKSLPRD